MSQRRKTRLLLYCHNAVGLGHIIRTTRIAAAAAEIDDCECRIITGCRFLRSIPLDPRVRAEELPAVRIADGSRIVSAEGDDARVLETRAERIEEFTRAWAPDVFLADHSPTGLGGELVRTLTAARREGWPTRFVWGLRDIQVAPQHAPHLIRRPANPALREALAAFCCAIGYSDKKWIDPFEAYKGWVLPPRLDYVGVVTRRPLPPSAPKSPTVVALSGGGHGGAQMFRLLLRAVLPFVESEGVGLRCVVGPFGSGEGLEVPEGLRDRVELLPESSTEEAVRDASLVVSRVGYNTAYTLVQTELPIVFVPLPAPGDEQGYRARLLTRLPNVSVVEQQSPGAEELLRAEVLRGLGSGRAARELPFSVDGARRAAEWLNALARAEAGVG